MADIVGLRSVWTELYSKTLPNLARVRDPAQPKWPVNFDHCFARIILDNTIGEGQEQWDTRLKRPPIKHMSGEQLKRAIDLAERIRDGKEDLVALDLQSLETRGKSDKKYKKTPSELASPEPKASNSHTQENAPSDSGIMKRKKVEQPDGDGAMPLVKKPKTSGRQSTLAFATAAKQGSSLPSPPVSQDGMPDLSPTLMKIKSHAALTPYRRRLYSALLSVPRGRYTTYAALSDFLNSSARAVGNGMRNNPFAPEVPCHRVLASDGSIGGFGGSWGIDGRNASKKFQLLKEEGVKFDSKGNVRGPPFTDFVALLEDG